MFGMVYICVGVDRWVGVCGWYGVHVCVRMYVWSIWGYIWVFMCVRCVCFCLGGGDFLHVCRFVNVCVLEIGLYVAWCLCVWWTIYMCGYDGPGCRVAEGLGRA